MIKLDYLDYNVSTSKPSSKTRPSFIQTVFSNHGIEKLEGPKMTGGFFCPNQIQVLQLVGPSHEFVSLHLVTVEDVTKNSA